MIRRSCATGSRPPSSTPGTGPSPSEARPNCWPGSGPTCRTSTWWSSTCGCPTRAASTWSAPSGSSTAAACRSWSSAARSAARPRSAIWPTSGVAGYVNEYSAVAAHPAVARAAPVPGQLQPPAPARASSLGIPVAYRFGNTIAAAVTLNLGQGGRGHPHDEPARFGRPAPGSASACPNSKRDVDADARVAWSDRRVGMGLQFERIDAADQSAVDEFVDAQFLQHATTRRGLRDRVSRLGARRSPCSYRLARPPPSRVPTPVPSPDPGSQP